jgi:hypothetical protein
MLCGAVPMLRDAVLVLCDAGTKPVVLPWCCLVLCGAGRVLCDAVQKLRGAALVLYGAL